MCLLYLSIFPARHVIKMKRLVHRWISQGLVCAQYGENVIEQATDYFNELINRNWIEPVNIKSDGQARACRVNNAILAFLVYKSAEEHFVTVFSCAEDNKERKKIRNLSIQNVQDVIQLGEVSHVRSLTIFGSLEQLSSPLKSDVLRFRSLNIFGSLEQLWSPLKSDVLRVLDLEDCKPAADFSGDINKTIVDASSLLHLRYLNIRAAGINGLGEKQITKMQRLETLDLRESLVGQLDITGLQQLVRLLVDSKTELKAELGNMKAVEEVKYISVRKHSEEFLKELVQLTKLRALGISLDEHEQGKALALVSSLRELGNCMLQSLHIDGIWEISLDLGHNGDYGQPILPSLRKLKFQKWSYFREVPAWMSLLKNLEKLRLGVSQLKQNKLAILGALPCLVDLFLDILEVHGEEVVFKKLTGFPYLKCLGISCRTRMRVKFESESVPCLEVLNVQLDVRDGVIPEGGNIILGIKNLPSLTRLDVSIYCIRETDDVVKAVKDAVQKEAGDSRMIITFTENPEIDTDGGALMSHICEKFGNLKNQRHVKRFEDCDIDINTLQDLLQNMRCSLQMVSDDENPKQQVKEWRNSVREFCYDMDEAIHSLSMENTTNAMLQELKNSLDNMRRALPKRMNKNIHLDMSGTSSSSSGSKTIDQSEEDGEAKMPAGCHSLSIDPRVEDLQGKAATLVGQRDTIITWLTSPGDSSSSSAQAPRLKVVSIFGFAGVGKTALAEQVYHSMKGLYDCTAIVTVSPKLSVVHLMRHILMQFDPWNEEYEEHQEYYESKLMYYIQDKSFFVILDGIWNKGHWDKIARVLSRSTLGGSIITTTRIRSVAKACCFQYDDFRYFKKKYDADGFLHEMKPLNTYDSKELFLQRVFGSEKSPSYPEQACEGMVQKCGGLPLSILTVSSMLAHNASPDRWEEIRKSMASGISKQSDAEDMTRILSLSYYDLPYPIRMCLLYLSMFPGGYEINRKDLINRWIADGLIEATDKKTKSVVGEYYFYELINRSLIQPVKIRYDGKVKACRVHGAILDFIVSKSIEENFVTIVRAQEEMSDKKIRRLSIQSADVRLAREMRVLPHIRSVALFGVVQNALFGVVQNVLCPMARVLSLENCPVYFQLSKFPHLEYFKCVRSAAVAIPSFLQEIMKLRYLQTVDLRHIWELPENIWELKHLVRLLVPKDTKLPNEIGHVITLEELKNVGVDCQSVSFFSKLAKLTKLRVLRINFDPSHISMDNEKALVYSLSRLGSFSLHSLSVEAAGEVLNFDSLWESAVKYLHKFSLRVGYISKVPGWMHYSLGGLKKLRLDVRNLDEHGLATLGSLQGLLDLHLGIHVITEHRLVCSSSSSMFPTLKYLCIRTSISGMSRLLFEDGAMPKVESIKLEMHADKSAEIRHKGLDFGTMKHLNSLKKAHVTVRIDGSIEKEAMLNIESAIRNGVKSNIVNLTFEIKGTRLKGSVVLLRKTALNLDVTSIGATVLHNVTEFLDHGVTCQLISSTVTDPNNGHRGKVSTEAGLERWLTTQPPLTSVENKFAVTFNWDVEKMGVPGAIIVKNNHATEFFLKTITLDHVPGKGKVVFIANSWVYPNSNYLYSRVFFTNDTYLPSQMPKALKPYRDDELRILRGDNEHGPYQEHDRVYRYDVYNDLGEPDAGNPRPTLGGSKDHPYPRRGRTGRKSTRTDPYAEKRLTMLDEDVYVPRDERLGHIKNSDFLGYSIKALADAILPAIQTCVDLTPGEFDSFKDVLELYEGIKLPNIPALEEFRKQCPPQLVKDIMPSFSGNGDVLLKLPMPKIVKEDRRGWMTDNEFAREILAGVNPLIIRRLTEFPPKSSLDPAKFGDHTSTITEEHILKNLNGLTVQEALDSNRLYILDHHDHYMPFLIDINSLEDNFIYATRTLFFLRGDGTLTPVAIELSLPKLRDGLTTAESEVYTPVSGNSAEAWVWHLAKAYVNVNDYYWHQGVSHWLNTHAVMEPFVIATNRHLSVTHPVNRLLLPHYRDTMNINALARQKLINAGGIFEKTAFPCKYAIAITSRVYASWNLNEQALPDDLIKRGMAVEDPSSPYKVRLTIEDYPYASDGLAIWHAIEQWVSEYLAIYYPNDGVLQADQELQAWWKEVREVGHGDLKDAPWWPEMRTVRELVKACATIIWIASALHAAVNFGQYPYCGYHPNRPSVSRQPMPRPGTAEYAELERDPEKVFLRTITCRYQAILGITLLEILSSHSSDEVYLGQRDTPEWTSDAKALEAFKRFGARLTEIEKRVVAMNEDPEFKNRNGPGFPYMLLYPNTSDEKGEAAGVSAKGIPNSISI